MSQLSPTTTIFLVDFDHTLFDMERMKEYLSGQLLKLFGSQYLVDNFWLLDKTLRKQPHYLSKIMKEFCEQHRFVEKRDALQNIFLHVDFALFLFSGAREFLRDLHQYGVPYIFSEGDELYQQVKVHKSGLSRYVSDTFIFDNKIKRIPELLESFRQKNVWMIDNKMSYLEQAKQQHPSLNTILINHYNFSPDTNFTPDFKAEKFSEILAFIQLQNFS